MSNCDDWLFESVIGFLNSPMWNLPIKNFMEANCFIFNPLDVNDEQNDVSEYRDLHKQYKCMVDVLLNTFLNDLGVTQTEFAKTCKRTNRFTEHPIYLDLFEQLWAADNFQLFKSLMGRKNVELELQAVLLLQYQLGLISNLNFNEDEIMTLVIKRSKDEYEGRNANISKYELEIAKNIVESSDTLKGLKNELQVQEDLKDKLVDLSLKEERKQEEKFQRAEEPKLIPAIPRIKSSRGPLQPPLSLHAKDIPHKSSLTSEAEPNEQKPNTVFELAQTISNSNDSQTNAKELERRAEFMRKQREILIQKKQVERKKQLDSFVRDTENTKNFRPMSSRAARAALANPEKIVSNDESPKTTIDEKEKKKLDARRALAEVLKKEVINNNKK